MYNKPTKGQGGIMFLQDKAILDIRHFSQVVKILSDDLNGDGAKETGPKQLELIEKIEYIFGNKDVVTIVVAFFIDNNILISVDMFEKYKHLLDKDLASAAQESNQEFKRSILWKKKQYCKN